MEQVGSNPHDSRLTLWVLFENGYDDMPEGEVAVTDEEYLHAQAFELMHDMLSLPRPLRIPPFIVYSGCNTERDEISFRGDTEFLARMRDEAHAMHHVGEHGGRFMMIEAGGPQDSRPPR
jgi:hypothetical protein